MSDEIVFILEPDTGRVTVEASQATYATVRDLETDLGGSSVVNCAQPGGSKKPGASQPQYGPEMKMTVRRGEPLIYLYRLYHSSTVDGPGRRSVVQVSGCSIRCPGCYVPETHERSNGVPTPIATIIKEIVAKRIEHDGVTILGGEPFDQPEAVAELVARLKARDFHIMVYTGNTIENLTELSDVRVDYILDNIDLLMDSPYIRKLGSRAGEYRGSSNQRLVCFPLINPYFESDKT